jgi:hypothetical protein
LIQSGARHYSEMIGAEHLPSPAYLRVFHEALAREKVRFARDIWTLAKHIAAVRADAITVVSLARAGTPIGVLVTRTLRGILGRQAQHYSVSIIRDRGIDETALRFILDNHAGESIAFLDGWTGKGGIARELWRAITTFNGRAHTAIDGGLFAVADLCGSASFAASADDYLIPNGILGATVSGLVSRSILNDAVVGASDFHGCLFLEALTAHDLSRWFVDEVYAEIRRQAAASSSEARTNGVTPAQRSRLRKLSESFQAEMMRRFGARNVNHIKPGIGEATRVLLRRVPDCVLVRDPAAAAVAHLLILAREKNTPVIVEPNLAYSAAALIKELDG